MVNISSLGADLTSGTGPILGLHAQEERLNRDFPGAVLHLRPGYFMENFFFSINLIKGQGINGSPLKPDLALPMIATRDISEVAAEALATLSFTGKSVRELLGPRDTTLTEATRILGAAIGRPELPYVQFPYDAAHKAMVAMGVSVDVANRFNEMYQGFNNGLIRPTDPRSPKNATPTTLEVFASAFAAAFRG